MNKYIALIPLAGLISCATPIRNITDNYTLYPKNKKAEKWGVIRYTKQYKSNMQDNKVAIELPNKEIIKGQVTYIIQDKTKTSYNVWDNVSFGFGVGGGSRYSHFGYGVTVAPRTTTIKSNTVPFKLDGFGRKTGMSCSGIYNRHQKNGTLSCDLTNGMKYEGHLRKFIVK